MGNRHLPIIVLLLFGIRLLSPRLAAAGAEGLPSTSGMVEQRELGPEGSGPQTASVTLDDIVVQAEREGPSQTDTSLKRIDREDIEGFLETFEGVLRDLKGKDF